MGKLLECAKVDPSTGCKHVIYGDTEADVLKRAGDHAKEHNIREVTPELVTRIKALIRDQDLEKKSFATPDDVRPFGGGKGKMEVVRIGGLSMGRGTFEPGWRWSTHVKPNVKTESCEVNHTGFVIEGRLIVRMNDGKEMEFGPGDCFVMPPGHDAWVVGDDRCVLIDVTGMG